MTPPFCRPRGHSLSIFSGPFRAYSPRPWRAAGGLGRKAKPPAGGAVRVSALRLAGRRSAQQPGGLLARRVAPARGSRAGAAKGRLPAASATRPRPVTGPRLRWRTWPRSNTSASAHRAHKAAQRRAAGSLVRTSTRASDRCPRSGLRSI